MWRSDYRTKTFSLVAGYAVYWKRLFGSRRGVQQGGPLRSLLFSLVILKLLADIGDIPELHLQLWYFDDGTFVGKRSSVASFLDLLSSKGPSHGLYINKKKCEVFWPSGDISFTEFRGEVIQINRSSEGAEFLGSPVAKSDSFFNQSFAKRVDNVLSCQDHLSDLEEPQVEMNLLRSCFSICKMYHLIRTVLPGRVTEHLSQFDHGVRRCLEKMFNSSMSDACWKQATLPVRLGGLGLREASRKA
ncbi:uncharacterized protein LOC134194331 [Corticium candelabrum]|uniref:uncharacterized protein LOC134194331 n=1 Tax=Corticium candelabrum TaxID=121492 RepID=UPI002E255A21|nr:uncharacterized protein LOC134194331 [Corticium candelabrum]